MTLRVSTLLGLLAIILPFVTASHWGRRHQEVAHRARGDVDIHRRQAFTNARLTFYDVGLGACGNWNVASDWIVALNVEQYGSGYPGPYCGQSITIQYGGLTAVATIQDECMGCPWGALDLSRGLFSYFANQDVGVIYATWWFNNGPTSSSQWTPPTTTWVQPTTTSTPVWTPPATSSTSDYIPPPTTLNYTPLPTTSTTLSTFPASSTSSSSAPSASNNWSSGLVSGSAVAPEVPAPSANYPENILVINDIMIEVGMLLAATEKNN